MNKLVIIIILFINIIVISSSELLCPDNLNYLKKWSDINSWDEGKLPIIDQSINITIPILMDIKPPQLGTIRIYGNGMLVWKHIDGLELRTKSILIYNGGQFIIGSEECRFKYHANITLIGDSIYNEINQTIVQEIDHNMDYGQKVIAVGKNGSIELHGEVTKVCWTKLIKNLYPNTSKIITVLDYVKDWPVGSEILLTSTDFDMEQSEVNVIDECPECGENQIKLKNYPQYLHWGLITQEIDERCEIGLLSRNIKIQGEVGTKCQNNEIVCQFFPFDSFGAHIMITNGFKNAHFYGVELYKVGQSHIISRYPIHFHMCGRVDKLGGYDQPAYIQHCTVHRSFSRCYVIHGTDGLLVHDNIGFDSIGHCFMLCDGIEMDNIITHNLGAKTKHGILFPHDRSCEMCTRIKPFDYNGYPTQCKECDSVSTYWISNPNNVFVNNIAAGSAFAGIWYSFSEYPSGISYQRGVKEIIQPLFLKVLNFTDNIAHSNQVGLQIDNGIKLTEPSSHSPEQLGAVINARYKPRSNPKSYTSEPAPSIFNGSVLYKNRWRGGWARGGWLVFLNFKIGDNAIGFTIASEGTAPSDPTVGQQMYSSLFIGETENYGQESSGIPFLYGRSYPYGENGLMPQRGFEIYDGTVLLENITFRSFKSSIRNCSAIGFFRYNDWQESSVTGLRNIKYQSVDREVHFESTMIDGDKTATIRDLDGTTTSIINSVLVRNFLFYLTKNCEYMNRWDGLLCKEDTRQIYIINGDTSNTKYIDRTSPLPSSVISVRDGDIDQSLELIGVPNSQPRHSFQFLVFKNHLYDFHFPQHPTPPSIIIQPMNWEINEKAIIGICIGISYGITIQVQKTTSGTFGNTNDIREIYSTYSKELVSESTYYLDQESSILYVMYFQNNARNNKFKYCPGPGCEEIVIGLRGPNVGRVTGDCTTLAYSDSFTLFDESVNRKFLNSFQMDELLLYNIDFAYRGEAYLPYHPSKNSEIKFQCVPACIPSIGIKYFEMWVNGGMNTSNQHVSIQLIYGINNKLSLPYHIEPFKFQSNSWVLIRIPFETLKSGIPKIELSSIISFNGLIINSLILNDNQPTIYLDNIKLIYDN